MISTLYERAVSGEQGLPPRTRAGRYELAALIAVSVLTAAIYVVSKGSVFTVVSLLGAVAVIVLTFYRIDWGFMFFVGCVLLFDQFPPRGYERSIIGKEYFQNLKSLPTLENVGPAVANPLELHLFLIILVWVMLIITGKKVTFVRVTGWMPAALYFSWLVLGAVLGIGRGGDFLPALWEIRALFYLGIMFFFVPQIIQTKDQVKQLFWVIIAALSFKTLQGVVRVANLGFSFGRRDELTSHEDPLFFVTLVVLAAGFFVYRYRGGQRVVPGLAHGADDPRLFHGAAPRDLGRPRRLRRRIPGADREQAEVGVPENTRPGGPAGVGVSRRLLEQRLRRNRPWGVPGPVIPQLDEGGGG